jgi:hypothetical protein
LLDGFPLAVFGLVGAEAQAVGDGAQGLAMHKPPQQEFGRDEVVLLEGLDVLEERFLDGVAVVGLVLLGDEVEAVPEVGEGCGRFAPVFEGELDGRVQFGGGEGKTVVVHSGHILPKPAHFRPISPISARFMGYTCL